MSETHFGFQHGRRADKAQRVRGVFDSVASKYDVMNDLMSLGLHRAWKAYTVAVANVRAGRQGARHRRRHRRPGARLRRAGRREPASSCTPTSTRRCCAQAATACSTTAWCCRRVLCDAETLPFADGRFDLVSVAFGLRNMTHKDTALAEMSRVLQARRPAAGARVLEGRGAARRRPTTGIRSTCCRGSASWWPATPTSYRYLAESIRMHPDQADAEGDDEDRRLRPCRRAQPERRRRRAARGDQVLSSGAPAIRRRASARALARPRRAAPARQLARGGRRRRRRSSSAA